ncbi:MAG: DUF1697 domain-containing protein [Gemmatimonadaceae bacterium]
MPRYAALLRAINVGGHTVKMDELRAQFEALRFARVESFIASGNIMFDTRSTATASLETRIEKQLLSAFGYPVETFLRTADELSAVIAHRPFRADDPVVDGHTLHVLFLKSSLEPAAEQRLLALSSDYDDFEVVGREVFWRCRGRSSDSKITPPMLARAMPAPGTARNITTVRKLAARLAIGAG